MFRFRTKKYPHASPLKLALPGGFDIFSENYFDLILHNHVLEHIPGNYQDHLQQLYNIFKYDLIVIKYGNCEKNNFIGCINSK